MHQFQWFPNYWKFTVKNVSWFKTDSPYNIINKLKEFRPSIYRQLSWRKYFIVTTLFAGVTVTCWRRIGVDLSDLIPVPECLVFSKTGVRFDKRDGLTVWRCDPRISAGWCSSWREHSDTRRISRAGLSLWTPSEPAAVASKAAS